MKRHHLFELEDLRWCPAFVRDGITDWLQQVVVVETGIYDAVAPIVAELIERQGTPAVVDLCSGAGGPWTRLKPLVESIAGPVTLTLSDRYPNHRALAATVAGIADGRTEVASGPVDARSVPAEVAGVSTVFTAVHHLRPDDVRGVLAGALAGRRAIGVFDLADRANAWRSGRTAGPAAWRTMDRVQPPDRRRLFWTRRVPVLPLAIAWDAMVSDLRAYRPHELLALTDGLREPGWTWRAGTIGASGVDQVTYLVGHPDGPVG